MQQYELPRDEVEDFLDSESEGSEEKKFRPKKRSAEEAQIPTEEGQSSRRLRPLPQANVNPYLQMVQFAPVRSVSTGGTRLTSSSMPPAGSVPLPPGSIPQPPPAANHMQGYLVQPPAGPQATSYYPYTMQPPMLQRFYSPSQTPYLQPRTYMYPPVNQPSAPAPSPMVGFMNVPQIPPSALNLQPDGGSNAYGSDNQPEGKNNQNEFVLEPNLRKPQNLAPYGMIPQYTVPPVIPRWPPGINMYPGYPSNPPSYVQYIVAPGQIPSGQVPPGHVPPGQVSMYPSIAAQQVYSQYSQPPLSIPSYSGTESSSAKRDIQLNQEKYTIFISDTKDGRRQRYSCNTCKKEFPGKSSIVAHLRSHTGEKPFACTYCARKFSQKSNCKRHEALHLQHPRHRANSTGNIGDVEEAEATDENV